MPPWMPSQRGTCVVVKLEGFCRHCGKRLADDDDVFCDESCQMSHLDATYLHAAQQIQKRHSRMLAALLVTLAAICASVDEPIGMVVFLVAAGILAKEVPLW